MASRLDGKTIIISGSGGPVGRATALRCAEEGARVVGADLNGEADSETAELVSKAGGTMRTTGSCDLTNGAQCEALVAFAVETFGSLDVLVNNASSVRFGLISDITDDDWSATVAGELTHVFKLTRAAWPALIESKGTIVNLGSTSALIGTKNLGSAAHSAAKAGVIAMTRQLAVEGAPHGIRANTISPGVIETPMFKMAFSTPEAVAAVTGKILRGKGASMDDIANIILFLASDESAHVNGTNLIADGGETAW